MYMNLLMDSDLLVSLASSLAIKTLFTVTIVCVVLVCFITAFRRVVYMVTGHYDINFNLAPRKKKRWTCEYCGTVNDDELTECPHCKGVRKMEDTKSESTPEATSAVPECKPTDGKIDTIIVKEKTLRRPSGEVYQKRQKVYKDLH